MVKANALNNNTCINLNILKAIGLKLYSMWDENSTINNCENLYCIWYKFKGRKLYDGYSTNGNSKSSTNLRVVGAILPLIGSIKFIVVPQLAN